LFDPESDQVADVNPVAERLTGFSRAELLAFQTNDLFHFEAGGGAQGLRRAGNTTMIFHGRDGYLMRTKQEGVWGPVSLTITRLHVKPRTLALITARDVREQHEAHARVKKMEAELRRVLNAVSDCLWSAEWAPDGRWTYRFLSPVVEALTGRPSAVF